MDTKFFEKQLKMALINKSLTQQDLAKELNVSQAMITMWANGKRKPKFETIKKISDYVGVPVSYFLEDEFVPSVKAIPLTNTNTVQLPILADVPAGLPEFSDRDVEMFVDIPRFMFPCADFVVKCIGDSLEPKIHKGDFCVIRKMQEPLDKRAMLVKTENGICMKIISKVKEHIKLCSLNQKYKPFLPKELTVIGLIIGHWSRDDKESW